MFFWVTGNLSQQKKSSSPTWNPPSTRQGLKEFGGGARGPNLLGSGKSTWDSGAVFGARQ